MRQLETYGFVSCTAASQEVAFDHHQTFVRFSRGTCFALLKSNPADEAWEPIEMCSRCCAAFGGRSAPRADGAPSLRTGRDYKFEMTEKICT
jgi:hypothetical protein